MRHSFRFLWVFGLLLVPFIACGDWLYDDPCEGVDCNDGNPCTHDRCEGSECVAAHCVHPRVENGTGCSLRGASGVCINGVCDLCAGVVCEDDGNECIDDVCETYTGTCGVPADNGTVCEYKGILPGFCASGFCAKSLCEDGTCDDGNECTDDMCDPLARRCSYIPVEDGTTCDLAGFRGVCLSGVCQPECEIAEDCDDQNDCTQDLCVDGMCELVPVTDGTPCRDGTGACQAGSCVDE